MTRKQIRQITGVLLIVGAVLVNVPYTMLITSFDYPDIVRAPADEILTQFVAGGSRLIWIWLSFAWVGIPILLAVLLLPGALAEDKPRSDGRLAIYLATFFGATSLIAQMIGLLRWPFVVSVLARMYTAPQATEITREAVTVAFQAVQQYGGVVIGEHMGQVFTIFWMILLSVGLLRLGTVPRWLPSTGLAAAVVYALAQGELLATAMPGFSYWDAAGLAGSLLWLAWLAALGIVLLKQSRSMTYEHAGQNPESGATAI